MKTFESIIFTKPFFFGNKEIPIADIVILIVRFPYHQNIFICVIRSYQIHFSSFIY